MIKEIIKKVNSKLLVSNTLGFLCSFHYNSENVRNIMDDKSDKTRVLVIFTSPLSD